MPVFSQEQLENVTAAIFKAAGSPEPIARRLGQALAGSNLMGVDSEERAFIEMADRQVEMYLLAAIAHFVRHTHPGLAVLENPQFPDFGAVQGERMLEAARKFDAQLATRPWLAGDRFTIADITGFCGVEFARLVKFKPADVGLAHLAAWRDRVAARPSAQF